MLISDYLESVYVPLRGICERTVRLYRYTIAALECFLGRQASLLDLEELTIARFLAKRTKDKAVATAAKDAAQLRAMWEFAARRGDVQTWPQIRKIRVPERVPEAWLTEEMQALLRSCAQATGSICGVPAGHFWQALVLLMYETGERAGAVLSLEWEDVRLDAVLFRAEHRKGGSRDIMRFVTPACAAALERIRRPRSLVFEWPQSKSMLWYRFGKILKAAGLPADRRSKFHRIRRTTASFFAAAGHDAQRLLDHSSPKTTKAYIDPRICHTPRACSVIPRLDADN